MSRRRRRSNKNDDATELAIQTAAHIIKNSSRRTLLVGGVLLLLLAVVVVGFLYLSRPAEPAIVDNPEEVASEIGRKDEPAVPGAVVPNLPGNTTTRTDWYELYFNQPVYNGDKTKFNGGIDQNLVALINRATKTLDVADYDFDLLNVADAMAAAKKRGVQVRMVTDSDTVNKVRNAEIQEALQKLKTAGIPIIADERGPIMHHKFTVVDKEWVQTGSWNYTIGDTYRLNNHMIIIRNRQLAENYSAEFEKMFVKKQFGPNKDKGVPNPVVNISGARVQNYFAAQDNVADRLIETVRTAKQSVYFLAFSFTHDGIAQAMLDRAKTGVKVGGVFENTGSNTQYSEFGKLKEAGLEVYQDGSPYVMHHKVIIIDERMVAFGSFNFSDNADKSNDENVLIVDDPTMARAFKGEYDRMVALAKNPVKR